jgi:hypothetical protein
MNMSNTLTQFTKIAMGCFLLGMGGMIFVSSACAEPEIITDPKPLETYNGTLEDLGETESRTFTDELAGVGGEYPSSLEIPSLEPNKNSLNAKTEALNETLEVNDSNLGDVERPTYKVPLIKF